MINSVKNLLSRTFLAISITALASCAPAVGPSPIENQSQKHDCKFASHRGDRTVGRDNSLAAINSAVAIGSPYIEVDLRRTLDGKWVLYHDKHLETEHGLVSPTSLIGKKVEESTFSEISTIRWDRGDTGLAQLVDALKSVKNSSSFLLLDLKELDAEEVKQLLSEFNELKLYRTIIQCQELEILETVRKIAPHVKVLARLQKPEDFNLVKKYHPEVIQIDSTEISPAFVSNVKSINSKLLVKSLDEVGDDERTWRDLYEQETDIILTDKPRELQESLKKEGFRDLCL